MVSIDRVIIRRYLQLLPESSRCFCGASGLYADDFDEIDDTADILQP